MSLVQLSYLLFLILHNVNSCGWYGPSEDSPTIPLGVCGNYLDGSNGIERSQMYDCDEGLLYKKTYNKTNCVENGFEYQTQIPSTHYSCNGDTDTCFGSVAYEVYSDCNGFVSGEITACTCYGSSYVEIKNTDVCLKETNNEYYIVTCDQYGDVLYKYYYDQQCTNATTEYTIISDGCHEETQSKYKIQQCDNAIMTNNCFWIMVFVFVAMFLQF